jgi:hypothetical protein
MSALALSKLREFCVGMDILSALSDRYSIPQPKTGAIEDIATFVTVGVMGRVASKKGREV